MDDGGDDAGYPPNSFGNSDDRQGYGSAQGGRGTFRSPPFSRPVSKESVDDYDEDEEEDEMDVQEEEEEEDDHDDRMNGGQLVDKAMDDDEDDDEEDEDDDEEDDGKQMIYSNLNEDADMDRHPKKRKLKSLVSSYEFARRVPVPPTPAPAPLPAPASVAPVAKPSSGGRNSLTDWTEHETFVLLDAWGERFLERGRKSLRSEEWQEVAEKVSEVSNIERTDTQCRNRLDTLKKKYKKDKMNFGDAGGTASKWVYFKKMDMLLSAPPQQSGLSCGLDSGEYVFMNPKVYLNQANGFDELRDSPGDSESTNSEEDDSDGLPPKKRKFGGNSGDGHSFRLLADSIKKFSKIYENIENTRRQQMVELENMRMNFRRELEVQKRQIMERAQAEIARLQGGDDENNVSSGDASG